MNKIVIERFDDPEGNQGRVADENGTWEVIIDGKGVPHFFVETNLEIAGGETIRTLFCIEQLLHDGMQIADLMQSTFGGELSAEEAAAAEEEWETLTAADRQSAARRWKRRPASLSDPARYPVEGLARMTDSQVRETYDLEKLPPLEDVAAMRALLARLRGGAQDHATTTRTAALQVIEDVGDLGTGWYLSFDGPNPAEAQCVRCVDRAEAFKLKGLIETRGAPAGLGATPAS